MADTRVSPGPKRVLVLTCEGVFHLFTAGGNDPVGVLRPRIANGAILRPG
jgi:hypothetical protein